MNCTDNEFLMMSSEDLGVIRRLKMNTDLLDMNIKFYPQDIQTLECRIEQIN